MSEARDHSVYFGDADRRRARMRFGDLSEAKLEAWFGKDVVESMHFAATGCHIPIQVMGVPVAAYRGMLVPQYEPVWADEEKVFGMTGFASLSDLISEATAGKKQIRPFNKAGTAGAVNTSHSLFGVGPIPIAGAASAAPPGGTVPTRASTGALGQDDAGGSDTLHVTMMTGLMSVAGSLMLNDFLMGTTTAANPGTGAIAVTGAQTRYTGAAGTAEYAAGNVITNRVTVVLPATAHNITYLYTDQDNNAGASSGAMTGRVSSAVHSTDFIIGTWAAALAAGDTGVRQLTSVQFSVSPATGQVEHRVIRPIAICPCPVVNVAHILDGINSAFNLTKVMVGACLELQEFIKTTTGAVTSGGIVEFVAG